MPKLKLTKRTIDRLNVPEEGAARHYDTDFRGLGLKVFCSGRKTFFYEFKSPETSTRRRMTIGVYNPMTLKQAQERSIEIAGEISQGFDPLEKRKKKQDEQSFSQWIGTYMSEVRIGRRSAGEINRYLLMAENEWGKRKLGSIHRDDVKRLRQKIAPRGNATANRWLAHLSACFEEAVRTDLLESNPVRGIEPLEENPPRRRVLSDNELERLLIALSELGDPFVKAAFSLIIDYGVRRSEVLEAQWDDIDLDSATWSIPRPKLTRRRKYRPLPRVIALLPETVALLGGLPRMGPYVIPGRNPDHRRYDLKKPWQKLKAAADLKDVTIHDLRRTFGLRAAKAAGLYTASKLLGHSSYVTTERVYAPFGLDDQREEAKKVPRPASVVPFSRRDAGSGTNSKRKGHA